VSPTAATSERPKRVLLGALVDQTQRDFIQARARENDRSLSAEVRRAIALYQQTETSTEGDPR
jgi:hypothetical protein